MAAILDLCKLGVLQPIVLGRFCIDDSEVIGEKKTYAICGGSFHIFIEVRWTAGV